MYIKNFATNNFSQLQIESVENLELIKFQKDENCLRLWLKIENQVYKFIILKEKDKYSFFVFDGFNNMNLYEISAGSYGAGDRGSANIIREGDYFFVVSPLSGKVEKINDKSDYEKDEVMIVISAMKMENAIVADDNYHLIEKLVEPGQFVDMNQKLLKLKKNEGFSSWEI